MSAPAKDEIAIIQNGIAAACIAAGAGAGAVATAVWLCGVVRRRASSDGCRSGVSWPAKDEAATIKTVLRRAAYRWGLLWGEAGAGAAVAAAAAAWVCGVVWRQP